MEQTNNWLTQLSPLELFLKECSQILEDKRSHFPSCNDQYFQRYTKAKEIFKRNYYDEIEASANVTEGNGTVYTKHGIPHVRSLIGESEKIIIWNSAPKITRINGYEAFLLLMSILLHDVGMFFGRKQHEKMCFKIIIKHYKEINISREEASTIAKIAEAHSGKDSNGQVEDTLSTLKPIEAYIDVQYRERMLASILRFADELSDNADRAFDFVESSPNVNDYSKLCHAYCKAITGISMSPLAQSLSIKYSISNDSAGKIYTVNNENLYLTDFILVRLEKMNKERAYCTKHFSEVAYFSTIKVELRIYAFDPFDFEAELFKETITIGEEMGYPSIEILKNNFPNFIGKNLVELIKTQSMLHEGYHNEK